LLRENLICTLNTNIHWCVPKTLKVTCENCGKSFLIVLSQFKSSKHHFCSYKCYWEWEKGKFTGSNHSTFKRMMQLGFPSDFQKQVIYVCLIGDGNLAKPKDGINYHLTIYHSIHQEEYLKYKHQLLKPFSRRIEMNERWDSRYNKYYRGFRFYTVSHVFFTSVYPLFYNNGKRKISYKILEMANEVAPAFLIGDDAHFRSNTISIATCNFELKDVEKLSWWLDGLKIASYITNYDYPRLYIPVHSLEKIRQLISPYLPNSMQYKIGGKTNSRRGSMGVPKNRKQEATCYICV